MLAVVGTTVTAAAQSLRVTKVNIPFEFNFGKQTFPAGEYTIVQPQPHLLMLRNSQGRILAQVLTKSVDSNVPATMTKVNFVVSEGRYSLAEVWREQDSAGEHLYQPKSLKNEVKPGTTGAGRAAGSGQP
jgi:hypothetical protein